MTLPADSQEHVPLTTPSELDAPRRSLASAAVYSLGFTVQRAIGLLMLPLYTRALAPAEYGDLGVLLSVSVALGLLLSAGLEPWIVRNYVQLADEPERRRQEMDSVWRFLVFFPLLTSFVLAAIAWPLFGDSRPVGAVEVSLTVVAAAVNVAGTAYPLAVLRARHDRRGFLLLTGITALLTPALTVLLVVVLDQGIRGWFLASLVSGIVVLAAAMALLPWQFRGRLRWPIVRTALIFSLPLIPHFLSHWALQLADRGIIAGMVSGPDLGRYTLAGILAGSVMMVLIALNQGFQPSYARAGATYDQHDALKHVVVVQATAVVTITLAGVLLGPPLLELLAPAAYHGAESLVPWLVLGFGFLGLYFIPMNGAALAVGRTRHAWVATAASAAVNIALLYLLVPHHGVKAAAIASAIGYLTLLVLVAAWAHARPNPVRYDWRRLLPLIVFAGIAYTCAQVTAPDSLSGEIAVYVVWLLAFAGAVTAVVFRSAVGKIAQRARLAWRAG